MAVLAKALAASRISFLVGSSGTHAVCGPGGAGGVVARRPRVGAWLCDASGPGQHLTSTDAVRRRGRFGEELDDEDNDAEEVAWEP
eukprot:CAMPEP_0204165778 /NCGR_PEP_ID=MMETSP0361-20130328/38446_1 /ASSEMBLY_ACC=CAM_ASM_000343 /TAXON_ID=268821 /ORGANISM="Scrippsiella Hangoei, Strain SHTV-5" /LENGTH=85 /DNA_ID=CAMNT_0051122825 /DNA_START=303 /DNA_END=557 /DNA_ORIENTATION=+